MKYLFLIASVITSSVAFAADDITYFSCTVKETFEGVEHDITVKFAIKDLKMYDGTGDLLTYPGADEDSGALLVTPVEVGEDYTILSNLNSQGGDVSIQGDNIHLFGDGDGYQFTDLVIWDVDYVEEGTLDGYIRDYGSAYAENEETFKQFIKCQKSKQLL